MSSRPYPTARRGSFFSALQVQSRVIGAVMMRELHTRYGRENVGYLWMILEPMILATVVGSMHIASGGGVGGHEAFLGNIEPVPFAVLGYTTFILFRGIVNRSAGALDGNTPLLYHRQVTVLDLTIARNLLEFCGVFLTFAMLWALMVMIGFAQFPVRPLELLGGWALVFFYSYSNSVLITAITYENRTAERLVMPYSYFMVFLSGAFIQTGRLPHPLREWMSWIPLTSMFELVRYGMFSGTNLDYFFGTYVIFFTAITTWIGMVLMSRVNQRIHLS